MKHMGPKKTILLPMFVPQFWRPAPLSKGPLQQGILLLQLLNPANSTTDRFELGNYEGLKVAICIKIMQYICMYYVIFFCYVCVCVHACRASLSFVASGMEYFSV